MAESKLQKRFRAARNAAVPLIAISTPDPAATIRDVCAVSSHKPKNGDAPKETPLIVWDVVNGVVGRNEAGIKAIVKCWPPNPQGENGTKNNLMKTLVGAAGLPERSILFVQNSHAFVKSDQIPHVQATWNLRDSFKTDNRTLILLAPQFPLPDELRNGDVVELDEPLPDDEALQSIIRREFNRTPPPFEHGDEVVEKLAQSMKGCAAFGAEQTMWMNCTSAGVDWAGLSGSVQKTIEQTAGLVYESGTETFADIGGLDFAKRFGEQMFAGPRRPALIVRVEELEKSMAGAAGDLSGTSQDSLQVMLSEMEDNEWSGLLAVGPAGCQPAGQKVLMADGVFKSVEDVRLGDRVLSQQLDGTVIVASVVSTAQHANRPVYRVSQVGKCKRSYLASGDHVLPVIGVESKRPKGHRRTRNWQAYMELTIEQFLKRGRVFTKKARLFTTSAIDVWPHKELPLHPYVVGCFLGDGGWSASKGAAPAFTTADTGLIDEQRRLGAEIGPWRQKKNNKAGTACYVGQTRRTLDVMGMRGKLAAAKSVPEDYLVASLEQRLELLAGLIDTDGTAVEFSSISRRLAYQFADLVHSVGGHANVKEVNWDDKMGREYRVFRVGFQFVDHVPQVRLNYKRPQLAKTDWKDPRRRAFSVEYVCHDTVYGFTLDSPSGLYVTNDWLVTHNSGKSLYSKALARTFDARPIRFDLNACKGSLVGESGRKIRAAMKVIKTIGGDRVFFIASVNRLDGLPPELKRRFRRGLWFFDLPNEQDRKRIWQIQRKRWSIDIKDKAPDEDDLTGADIRNICETAYSQGISLRDAMQFVVPLKVQDPDSIEAARRQANGRFIDANKGGVYKLPTAETAAAGRGRSFEG